MKDRDLLSNFRASLPRASAMQIGWARVALMREIEREHGAQPFNHHPAPLPRLTLVALFAAALLCCVLLVMLLGIVHLPH